MIKPICRDTAVLSKKAVAANVFDLKTAEDLLDTLTANADRCVGMAANMIGVAKSIIVFDCAGTYMTMFNPEIVTASGEYDVLEGCLSLDGKRPVKRYTDITVRYQDSKFKTFEKKFSGWTAEIIQHEIDHCNGILI